MKRVTGMSLSEEVLEMVDSKRGFVPRSALIENILRERLGMEKLVPGQRSKSATAIKKEGEERLR